MICRYYLYHPHTGKRIAGFPTLEEAAQVLANLHLQARRSGGCCLLRAAYCPGGAGGALKTLVRHEQAAIDKALLKTVPRQHRLEMQT